MWFWYLRAQELANERYAEARQSRLGQLARPSRHTSEHQRPVHPVARRSHPIG